MSKATSQQLVVFSLGSDGVRAADRGCRTVLAVLTGKGLADRVLLLHELAPAIARECAA